MNIALLTAGGVGNRMGQDIPKQFMSIENKPVIIYTLQAFQNCTDIDKIAVVCLKGWEVVLRSYANQYSITKLEWIFEGGETNHASIRNGVEGLAKMGCAKDDIVLVHDAVRPLVSNQIIKDNIIMAQKFGSAVTGLQCKEVIMKLDGCYVTGIDFKREHLIRTQTPHTYRLGILLSAHAEAKAKNYEAIASCDLLALLGNKEQHWVKGSEKNGLKLTNAEDIELFKSLLLTPEETWIKQ